MSFDKLFQTIKFNEESSRTRRYQNLGVKSLAKKTQNKQETNTSLIHSAKKTDSRESSAQLLDQEADDD